MATPVGQANVMQGDQAGCSKPPVDIDVTCESCVLVQGPDTKTQLSHQCQREVWNKLLTLPVVQI